MRLQVQGQGQRLTHGERLYSNVLQGLVRVVQKEGARGLYNGWVAAALFREIPYSGLRVGLYEPFKELFGATDPSNTPLWKKGLSGICSGTIAAFAINPFDIMKVRYCAANHVEYRLLGPVVSEVQQLYGKEGLRGLWRGVGPSTLRGATITAVQLSSYDHIKHMLLNAGVMGEGSALHFTASVGAATCAVICTNPMDVVKTRVMNQRSSYLSADATSAVAYKGPVDCARKIMVSEGPMALYKGTTGAWLRLGPHTIVTFMVFEQLRALFGVRPI